MTLLLVVLLILLIAGYGCGYRGGWIVSYGDPRGVILMVLLVLVLVALLGGPRLGWW